MSRHHPLSHENFTAGNVSSSFAWEGKTCGKHVHKCIVIEGTLNLMHLVIKEVKADKEAWIRQRR